MKRLAVLTLLALAGCAKPKPAAEPPPVTTAKSEHDDHDHDRGKMMVADAGPYHALLTAHLSKAGHELDVFFEAADEPKPAALPIKGFVAEVQVPGGGLKEVQFKPAPDDERPPGEGPDRCSHFVAAAPWLDPDAPLRAAFELKIDGKRVKGRWNEFVPRKYAHHQD